MPAISRQRFYAMDAGAIKWMQRTAARQFWRVSPWMNLDDLLQDGYVCWFLVRSRYPQIEKRSHRMALFKRVFTNHLHDLANKRSHSPEVVFGIVQTEVDNKLDSQPCETADMMQAVAETPTKVRALLNKMLRDPSSLGGSYDVQGMVRETLNQRLCRLTGLNPHQNNLHDDLRAALVSMKSA